MMQRIEHRPYEAQAVHDLRIELPAHKRVLAVAPTGAGKTVIATLLIGVERRWRRVLWLAHRAELIEQARQSLIGLGVPCGVRCASYEQRYPEHVDHEARVQVGSVQTVIKREVFDVDLIVIDEAHRAMADTYQQIIKMRPRAEVLGLTATPIPMAVAWLSGWAIQPTTLGTTSLPSKRSAPRRSLIFETMSRGRRSLRRSVACTPG